MYRYRAQQAISETCPWGHAFVHGNFSDYRDHHYGRKYEIQEEREKHWSHHRWGVQDTTTGHLVPCSGWQDGDQSWTQWPQKSFPTLMILWRGECRMQLRAGCKMGCSAKEQLCSLHSLFTAARPLHLQLIPLPEQ